MRRILFLFIALLFFAGCGHVAGNYPNRPMEKKNGWVGDVFEDVFSNENMAIRVATSKVDLDYYREVEEWIYKKKRVSLTTEDFKKYKIYYQNRNPVLSKMKIDRDHDYYKVEIKFKTQDKWEWKNGFFVFQVKLKDKTGSIRDKGIIFFNPKDKSNFIDGLGKTVVFGGFLNESPPKKWSRGHVRVPLGARIIEVSFDETKISVIKQDDNNSVH